MQNFEENLASRVNGSLQPLLGVSVTVKTAQGLLATIYSDNGATTQGNPMTTDANGRFGFYAANGDYVLTFSGPQIQTYERPIDLYDPDDAQPFTQAQAALPSAASRVGFQPEGQGEAPMTIEQALNQKHFELSSRSDKGIGPPEQNPLTWYGGHAAKTSFASSATASHPGVSLGTMAISRHTVGSGAFGPAAKDYALLVSIDKTDYLTSTVDGELDTLVIAARQGRKGDVAAVLMDVQKVRTGGAGDTGGITPIEMRSAIVDATGAVVSALHNIPAFAESNNGLSSGGGYGQWVETRKGAWFSAYHAGNTVSGDGAYEGANSFLYAATAATSRNIADLFYAVQWGTGNIFQGKPSNRRVLAYDPATELWQIKDETGAVLFTVDSAGIINAPAGVQIGGGAVQTRELIYRGTIDPPSIAANATVDLAGLTVPGAAIGDLVDVYITTTNGTLSALRLFGTATGANTVTLKATNTSSTALDAVSLSYVVIVRRYV